MFLREITASVHVLHAGLVCAPRFAVCGGLRCGHVRPSALCVPDISGAPCRYLRCGCAHLVWLRGQGVAACGRMYGGRRVKRKFAVWRYRVWGYRAVLWNIVSRMWKSCSRQAVSKSVNIKNRSNLGICCLGNCVRCGFHKFMENGFAGGITAGREAACGRNHRSIFGVQQACHIKYGGAAVARPCYDFYCLITA